MKRDCSLKWSVIVSIIDPLNLTFNLSLPKPCHYISQSHSLHQVWTLWDNSFLSYAADKQTISNVLPTPTDIIGVGNYRYRKKTAMYDREWRWGPSNCQPWWCRQQGSSRYTCTSNHLERPSRSRLKNANYLQIHDTVSVVSVVLQL